MEFNKTIKWIGSRRITPATKKFELNKTFSESEMLRKWDPFENTLSAAIMSGLEIIPINDTTNILYIGKIDEEGRLNLLDLVNNKQKIFIFNKKSIPRNLKLNNLANINNLDQIKGELFSIVYINDSTISVEEIIKISKEFLNEFGYMIVILSRSSESEFKDSFNKLSKWLHVIQEVNIENYLRDTSLIIFSNKKIISKFN